MTDRRIYTRNLSTEMRFFGMVRWLQMWKS